MEGEKQKTGRNLPKYMLTCSKVCRTNETKYDFFWSEYCARVPANLFTSVHTRISSKVKLNIENYFYLFNFFYVWVVVGMVDMIRPHPLLSFVQSYNL